MLVEQLSELDYVILNKIYVEGFSAVEVAKMCEVSEKSVAKLLARKEIEPLLTSILKTNEQELIGLEVLATDILRKHLNCDSMDIQQKAIDKVYKRNGAYKNDVSVNITAEDVIKQFMNGGATEVQSED